MLFLFTVLLAVISCNQSNKEYEQSINNWHQLRIDSLKGETGFLNLAGLYWLEKGLNTFGSDSTNRLNFTPKSTPILGSFLLKDSTVFLIPKDEISIGGKIILDTTVVFENGESKTMNYNSLHWTVIKRGDDIGIRLRDFEYPLLGEFDSIDYFETDPGWRVEAIWEAYEETKKIPFSNVLGMSIEYPVYGEFKFTIENKEYKLEPLGKPDSYGYFIMFYDKTSGHNTYGSGRYLYVNEPDSLGHTFIDFNKAYNPPCAFTEFATCLFPHKKNRLPISVNAGEKFSGH